MHPLRLIRYMLEPSLLSLVSCTLLALVALGIVDWAFVTHNSLLYDYFFGPSGLVTTLQDAPHGFEAFWRSLFAHRFGSGLLTYLFILLIAVVVYSLLEAGLHLTDDARTSIKEVQRASREFKAIIARQAAERVLLRICIALGWFVYSMAFLKIILPFCISSSRYGIATITQWHQWGYLIGGIAVLVLALHLHIIFTRLLLLRPRVFGGVQTLLAAERNH